MVAPSKSATLAATPAPPSASSFEPRGEHIYIGSEDTTANPAAAAHTLRQNVALRNPIRRTGTELALYEEGFLKVTELRNGNAEQPFFLDLRFIDPLPTIERVLAARWLATSLGCGALSALAAFLMRFDALYSFAATALGIAALASAVALYVGVYLSHEKNQVLHAARPRRRARAHLQFRLREKISGFRADLEPRSRRCGRPHRHRHGGVLTRRNARSLSTARRRRTRQRRVR
jgi:hypothetical protein